jgi:hypothetical protein
MAGRGCAPGAPTGWLIALAIAAACHVAACHGKKPIAVLDKAEQAVERQTQGASAWGGAPVGTKFYLGDAARTAAGGAQLSLGGDAHITMQPHTVLRFIGTADSAKIAVDLGAVDLSGGGDFGLDIGDVKLGKAGTVRVTAKGQGHSSIELLVGDAQVTSNGTTVQLELGKAFELDLGTVQVAAAPVDAAASPVAVPPADAAVADDVAHVEITGKRAEVLPPGETKWQSLAAGTGTIAKGARLRLGNGTTAKLVAGATTLQLAGGSRATVSDNLISGVELGVATASVPAAVSGTVTVPGGELALQGDPTSAAEAKLDVNARGEAKVTIVRGGAKLTGANGAGALDMNRGESADLAKAGTIHVLEAIPTYFDFGVILGSETSSFTIHDPKASTALRFEFGGKCANGGVVELDRDSRFRAPRVSSGKEAANVMVTGGGWAYRLRCTTGDNEGPAVASGTIVERADDGRRPLPKEPPVNPIDADGRTYRISYQSLVPNIKVRYSGAGAAFKLHLATGGADETIDSATSTFTVPGNKLKEATYTYWVDHDGVKQDKVSTLIINFDQTAPQVYIEAPPNGQPFGPHIDVKGAVLPGWSAKVAGVDVPVDKGTRRFNATVDPPEGQALAIRLAHPKLGVHYYMRRGK